MMRKIKGALAPDGIFCGSESLGFEGVDHQQFFQRLEDLHDLLSPYFPHVWVRKIDYQTGKHFRQEAFWRAGMSSTRAETSSWQRCGDGSAR
jgi:hypothetical protein